VTATVNEFGLPTTLEEVREGGFVDLFHNAFLRGFSLDTLMCCYAARANATQEFLPMREFLIAVNQGEFDFLLKDRYGQSFS